MASITGGNAMVMASVTIGLMFIILVVFVVNAFDLDRFLSVNSWTSDGKKDEPAVTEEVKVEEEPTLEAEEVRQLLGFIDYPVVKIEPRLISLFSPEAQEGVGRLSEEEIQQRCAFISIDFNRDRCVQAERVCAEMIASDQQHWACLNSNDFWIGKDLAYGKGTTK